MKITAFNHLTGALEEKLLSSNTDNLQRCVIGRHPSCDLILNSPEISRVHAIILGHQGNHCFIDLASTDGSRINNQEVEFNQEYPLKAGDAIRIGDFLLLFEEVSDESKPYWFLKPQETNSPKQVTIGSEVQPMFRCSQIIDETHDVKTFCLVSSPSKVFDDYKPGQFVTLDLEINGQQIKRSYSISSTPSRPHALEITVKRVPSPSDVANVPPGLVSNWLHDNFKVGSSVKISPPMGKFTCFDHPNEKFLFISAGSGITPMMSMSRWLCDVKPDVDVIFVHSAKTIKDIIFRQELELMASRYPNFKLAVTLTGNHHPTWSGYSGRLNNLMLQAIAPDFKERLVYVCGSDGFRNNVKTILEGMRFPMSSYHEESFGSNKRRKSLSSPKPEIHRQSEFSPQDTHIASTSSSADVVVFTKSHREVVCEPEETILEAAQREGIRLPYGCQMGACGQCKLHKVSGEVVYEDDSDCENDFVLTCVARAAGRVTIEG
ncbi:FHA domain-containing protein [Mastigocoleus sp. MO_188.B34]|uniref:FHA domain-containing protein n=1 Tax=Mastigocoleus sp. MO_188.B34 TaxID=3036635 RepID=UPI00261D13C0|nr:FHA domain-containing protein [Mastigocoleus sp. MO_188.B34]MDJ0692976.1 FHA domain-containing protein [Mastigocoleus sp. MO_188.B34]